MRNETWSGVLVAGGVNSESLLANAEVKSIKVTNPITGLKTVILGV